jgi:PAS domain S-box-containing protein
MHGDAEAIDLYQSIVDSVPEAIVVTTLDGRITFVNRGAEALTGYAAHKLTGRSITVFAHAQPGQRADPVQWLARWAAQPPQEQARYLDLQIRRADGQELIVGVRVSQGVVSGEPRYFVTVRDMTSWRKEITAFKDANLLAQRILLVAEDAIVSCDADQKITFFNLSAEVLFGYQAEDVIGQPLTMLMPEWARQSHAAYLRTFGAGSRPSQMMSERREIVGRRRSGETFPLEAAISKVTVGRAITFTAHVRDITARKAAQAQLEETERRFQAIFDHAQEAIALLSPEGRLLEFNRSAQSFLDGAEAPLGADFWDLPWIGGGGQASGEEGRARLKSAVAAAASGLEVRYVAELRDGDGVRRVDLSLTPITDAEGRVIYILPEGRELAATTRS